jgi:transcriptional regulator with GAF, ATPase, and Fis domain
VQRARDRPTISQAMEVAGGRVSSPGGAAARLGMRPITLSPHFRRMGAPD